MHVQLTGPYSRQMLLPEIELRGRGTLARLRDVKSLPRPLPQRRPQRRHRGRIF